MLFERLIRGYEHKCLKCYMSFMMKDSLFRYVLCLHHNFIGMRMIRATRSFQNRFDKAPNQFFTRRINTVILIRSAQTLCIPEHMLYCF